MKSKFHNDQKGNDDNISALKKRKSELNSIKKSLKTVAKNDAVYASGNGVIGEVNITSGSELNDSTEESSSDKSSSVAVESDNSSESLTTDSIRDEYFGTAFTLTTNDTMSMEVTIDELDISSVKKGQDVTIELDAVEGDNFSGKVTKINNDISISNGIVSYSAKIELMKTDNMKAGMSANATIIKESKENVLIIPVSAIQEDMEGQFVYTSLEEENLSGKTRITTGLSDSSNVEVTEGLAEGDTVYYQNPVSESDENQMMMPDNMPERGDAPSGGPGQGSIPGEESTQNRSSGNGVSPLGGNSN